jgi:hypothetical protein
MTGAVIAPAIVVTMTEACKMAVNESSSTSTKKYEPSTKRVRKSGLQDRCDSRRKYGQAAYCSRHAKKTVFVWTLVKPHAPQSFNIKLVDHFD